MSTIFFKTRSLCSHHDIRSFVRLFLLVIKSLRWESGYRGRNHRSRLIWRHRRGLHESGAVHWRRHRITSHGIATHAIASSHSTWWQRGLTDGRTCRVYLTWLVTRVGATSWWVLSAKHWMLLLLLGRLSWWNVAKRCFWLIAICCIHGVSETTCSTWNIWISFWRHVHWWSIVWFLLVLLHDWSSCWVSWAGLSNTPHTHANCCLIRILIHTERGALSSVSPKSTVRLGRIRVIIGESSETRVGVASTSDTISLEACCTSHSAHRLEASTHRGPFAMSSNVWQHSLVLIYHRFPISPAVTCITHSIMSLHACTRHAHLCLSSRASDFWRLPIPALSSVCLTEISLWSSQSSGTRWWDWVTLIRTIERSKWLLRISHWLVRWTLSLIGISDKVRSMGWSSVWKHLGLSDHLKILVLVTHVFVFNHNFANWGLFGEIKLIDTLFE